MALRLATVAAVASLVVGPVSLPLIALLPAPLMLCALSIPVECIAANLSGASYLSGDSPAAFWWTFTLLVIAPGISVIAVWRARRGHPVVARALALVANAPVLVYVGGTYAIVPFHPVVAALTLTALIGLFLWRPPA